MAKQNITVGKQYGPDKKINSYIARIRNKDGNLEYIVLDKGFVEKITNLYVKDGENKSAAAIAHELGGWYTEDDVRRILEDCSIRKDTPVFADHVFEETTQEERDEMFTEMKRHHYMKKAYEENRVKCLDEACKRMAKVANQYREMIKTFNGININCDVDKIKIEKSTVVSNKSINLYVSDVHMGAVVPKNSMYSENKNYGEEEATRRLMCVVEKLVKNNYHFDTINVVVLGDSVNNAGKKGETARGYRDLDENMTSAEQIKAFSRMLTTFVAGLVCNNLANHYKVYTVPCGNHDGDAGRIAHTLALNCIKSQISGVETVEWEEYQNHFEQDGLVFITEHGKDDRYHKKAMPATWRETMYGSYDNYVIEKGLNAKKYYIIKGDLHVEAITGSGKFSYRNVLSLFGASEYANKNCPKGPYGVSYDIIQDGELIRGTFENMQ